MSDDLQTLEHLAELRDRGVLTAQEFEAKKREILSATGSSRRRDAGGETEGALTPYVTNIGRSVGDDVSDQPNGGRRGLNRNAIIAVVVVIILLFPFPKTNASGATSTTNLIAEIGIALSGGGGADPVEIPGVEFPKDAHRGIHADVPSRRRVLPAECDPLVARDHPCAGPLRPPPLRRPGSRSASSAHRG